MTLKEAERVLGVTAGKTDPAHTRRSVVAPSRLRQYEPVVIGTLSVISVIAVWQLVANARIMPVLFLPGPWDVAQAFVKLFQSDEIWIDMATSGEELIIGFVLASAFDVRVVK